MVGVADFVEPTDGGDFRDPLVGRDILVGGLWGFAARRRVFNGSRAARSVVIIAPSTQGNTEGFSGISGMAVHFLHGFAETIFLAMFLSFLLLLLLTVLRKKWLAIAAMWIFIVLPDIANGDQWIFWLNLLLTATFITLAAARFGLLALYAFFLVVALSSSFPITSDFSSW